MLTYDSFLKHNAEADICFRIFSNRIEIEKSQDCEVREFKHNFNDCIKLDYLDNLILDIVLPKRPTYTVKINYREDRKIPINDPNKIKKWQYAIQTKNGAIVKENELSIFEEIIKDETMDTKEKIIKILEGINYKNIIDNI